VDNQTIDKVNILNASFMAMANAINQLSPRPQISLIDGHMFRCSTDIPHECIVKGDSKYAAIAAASILAKVERDRYMKQLHPHFSSYGWDRNVGYPTKRHIAAIKENGFTIHHRHTFQIKALQLTLM
jgi:ribonuclease HII